ncbi:hypothetical protein AK812_SmicGene14227 [Symbiodinium microadriaticum]|uniref:Uncharacterized protein n=1 Tax=Symbiodinium microadriaticum TaxID=2951 RepID=A0A1Q9E638_SYMMI|nr:hypothetical protein AK812_SmicGene14227 [Symbiodinium microadriaticum]
MAEPGQWTRLAWRVADAFTAQVQDSDNCNMMPLFLWALQLSFPHPRQRSAEQCTGQDQKEPSTSAVEVEIPEPRMLLVNLLFSDFRCLGWTPPGPDDSDAAGEAPRDTFF